MSCNYNTPHLYLCHLSFPLLPQSSSLSYIPLPMYISVIFRLLSSFNPTPSPTLQHSFYYPPTPSPTLMGPSLTFQFPLLHSNPSATLQSPLLPSSSLSYTPTLSPTLQPLYHTNPSATLRPLCYTPAPSPTHHSPSISMSSLTSRFPSIQLPLLLIPLSSPSPPL